MSALNAFSSGGKFSEWRFPVSWTCLRDFFFFRNETAPKEPMNLSPRFEWPTTTSQSTPADKTHSTLSNVIFFFFFFDRSESFPFSQTLIHRGSQVDWTRVTEKNRSQHVGAAKLVERYVSWLSTLCASDTLVGKGLVSGIDHVFCVCGYRQRKDNSIQQLICACVCAQLRPRALPVNLKAGIVCVFVNSFIIFN